MERRNFLHGLTAFAASAFLASDDAAQTPPSAARVIDCHHHYGSPAWIANLAAREGHKTPGFTTNLGLNSLRGYTPARDIESMDRDGVAAAMLSCTEPGVWFGDPDEARRLARDMNDFGARMVSDHRNRFGLFGVLPIPAVEDSLREIEYVFDTLKADGVGILTSYGNHWLGEPMFQPVFDELNRRKAVVYVHPIDALCCQELMPNTGAPVIEFNTDTSRAIFSLIGAGAATRYSDIRFIFSHAGGTMPSLVERFGIGGPDDLADNLSRPAEKDSRLFHLRRFYYDTAQSSNPVQMQALKSIVGASQIVFGTDYPFGSAAKHLAGLEKCGFSAQELRGIHSQNALRILPALTPPPHAG
jgi:predicted TIM-barrel fold metal-dependent hydrolase